MAYLFDTDAISELLRPRPAPAYVEWLTGVPREDQFTSAVVIGELYRGAFRSPARERHLVNIRQRIIPAVTVLPYDVAIAEVYGLLSADLEEAGQVLADADLQIAATAVYHNLELVSGNLKHFARISQLRSNPILTRARRS
jgi:predicted nucleic acid-binding protein